MKRLTALLLFGLTACDFVQDLDGSSGGSGPASSVSGNGGAAGATTSASSSAATGAAGATASSSGSGGEGPAGTAWAHGFGSTNPDLANDVAIDPENAVIVIGSTSGTVDFGLGPLLASGPNDAFVAKYDADGVPLWAKVAGDGQSQRALSVATDASGNIVVVGAFQGAVDFGLGPLVSAGGYDYFVVELDAGGIPLWQKRAGDQQDQWSNATVSSARVAVDAAGNVVVAGSFQGSLDLGGPTLTSLGPAGDSAGDVFVVKLDPSGNHLWSLQFGDFDDDGLTDAPTGLATDDAGHVFVGGGFGGTVDFGGGPLDAGPAHAAFAVELDAAGTHLYSHAYPNAYAYGLAADGDGSVALVGLFTQEVDFGGGPLTANGQSDMFLTRLDPSGNHVFSERFDAALERPFDVAFDRYGSIGVAGSFEGTIDFGGGALTAGTATQSEFAFLALFDAAGAHLSSTTYGAPTMYLWSDKAISGLAFDPSGHAALAGYFIESVDVGGALVTSNGGADGFVARVEY